MGSIALYADVLMCVMWVFTYILVLISTYKTKIPAIPIISCVVVFPWELVAAVKGMSHVTNYAAFGQLGLFMWDFAIFLFILFGLNYYSKKQAALSIGVYVVVVVELVLAFQLSKGQLYTCYIHTLIGMLFWLHYAGKSGYPLTKLNFAIAVSKFAADILALMAYHNYDMAILLFGILLPLVDLIHILVLLRKFYQRKHALYSEGYGGAQK